MNDRTADTIATEVAEWRLLTAYGLPLLASEYRDHAQLAERFPEPPSRDDDAFFFAAIGRASDDWPSLVISQQYSPSGSGFTAGVLVVPETHVVFLGAGSRLLCYQQVSDRWKRVWQDETWLGFWGWRRHDGLVVMSAETEMAAYSLTGARLWSTDVEPSWSYEVTAGSVRLDVMGTIRSFPLEGGPPKG